MKMLDKERRRKKCREKDQVGQDDGKSNSKTNSYSDIVRAYEDTSPDMGNGNDDLGNNSRSSNNSNHTEIRTDDFVVRLLFINWFMQTQRQSQQLHRQRNMNELFIYVDFAKNPSLLIVGTGIDYHFYFLLQNSLLLRKLKLSRALC